MGKERIAMQRSGIPFIAHEVSLRAFTLLELLVTVTIIGVLTAIVVPHVSLMKIRASITAAKHNLVTLAHGVQAFQTDHGKYPSSIAFDSRIDLQVIAQGNGHLSSVEIPDPFQRPPADESLETNLAAYYGWAIGSPPNQHGFVYVNYHDFLSGDMPPFQGFGIYSLGPDRTDSWLSLYPLPESTQMLIRRSLYPTFGDNALQPIAVYNPTNGIFSDGDFGVFCGEFNGFVPQDAF